MTKLSTLASIAALALSALPAAAASSPKPDPEVERGRKLYAEVGCYECHGYVGQGAIGGGPALAPKPQGEAYYKAYVRAPRGQMPGYSQAILSDDQLSAIHRYLESIPVGRAAEDIPLLSGSAKAK